MTDINNINNIIKTFSTKPGVYIMKDNQDNIIYIGKAKNLKKRVSSYFNKNTNQDSKVAKLVKKINNIDYIVTGSELEALILECNLIKKYRPIYNILLKDDKGYKFIRVPDSPYQRISVVSKKQQDKSRYIGPYMSNFAAKEIVQTVNKIFKLPSCNRELFNKNKYSRPCLNYYINLCEAPCCCYISKDEYKNNLKLALNYIKSGMKSILKLLQKQMEIEAENLNFEKAAKIRDQIKILQKVDCQENVTISEYSNADILAALLYKNYLCATLLIFRDYKLIDKKQYIVSGEENISEIRKIILLKYYTDKNYKLPEIIYLDGPVDDFELLKNYIFKNIKIIFKQENKNNKLIEMAENNSRERILQEIKIVDKDENKLEDLKDLLKLKKSPEIIEAYDISNFGSEIIVGAMVVFQNARPKKSGYRRFKIKTLESQDDYNSMCEIINRRLEEYKKNNKNFNNLPDLILIDGGYNHISCVNKILKNHNLEIPIFGMIKNKKHETEALVNLENKKINIKNNQTIFLFIKKIQDEIHRFAIAYSINIYNKSSDKSILTKIKGVGKSRQKKLIAYFKTIKNIKNASENELKQVDGISKSLAKEIFEFFKLNP
ncbi:MAG: excinuclease ABC subunit UvrC [Oscillospiraceae bacterium]|nr:excinuclease ABC subunit UvrC [Oscillospiraceae bacterium]